MVVLGAQLDGCGRGDTHLRRNTLNRRYNRGMAEIPDGGPYELGKDIFLGERVVCRGFTCARCGSSCMTSTTEVEANREFLQSGQPASEGIASVCDDCYEYLMARAAADGLLAT